MFSSSRVNQTIYILYKESVPRIEIGNITQVTQPVFKFPTAPQYGQMQEQVVDVYVNVNGAQRQFQQLPANKESADFGTGNVFVTISRDAMNAEISSLKNESVGIINRVDEERQKIARYDEILMQLNPEFAEKQRQDKKITILETQVAELKQSSSKIESLMTRILEKLENDESKLIKKEK